MVKWTIQVATKERIPIKEEGGESSEIYNVPKIYQKLDKEQEPSEGFLDELIRQAKFIQDILTALEVMLKEIQENLGLLPEESKERILRAVKEVVE